MLPKFVTRITNYQYLLLLVVIGSITPSAVSKPAFRDNLWNPCGYIKGNDQSEKNPNPSSEEKNITLKILIRQMEKDHQDMHSLYNYNHMLNTTGTKFRNIRNNLKLYKEFMTLYKNYHKTYTGLKFISNDNTFSFQKRNEKVKLIAANIKKVLCVLYDEIKFTKDKRKTIKNEIKSDQTKKIPDSANFTELIQWDYYLLNDYHHLLKIYRDFKKPATKYRKNIGRHGHKKQNKRKQLKQRKNRRKHKNRKQIKNNL